MKVFVAGATGAIGRPLIRSLTLAGHTTFGMVRSQNSSASLSDWGAEPVIADALDAPSVSAAVAKVRPGVIINELTSLPKHYTPTDMKAAAERDARVRLEGNKNLIAAAQQTGVRRFLVQSTGFWYAPGEGLADEGERFAYAASPAVAVGAQRYAELEAMTLSNQVRGRRPPVRILLRTRHLVHVRRRYGRTGASAASADHRLRTGSLELGTH